MTQNFKLLKNAQEQFSFKLESADRNYYKTLENCRKLKTTLHVTKKFPGADNEKGFLGVPE